MWDGFFEHLRNCGRDATLFIVAVLATLAGFIIAPALGWLAATILFALIAFGVFRLVLAWKHACQGFERLGRLPPLSEQDRHKARAMLMRKSARASSGTTQRIALPPTGSAMALRRA